MLIHLLKVFVVPGKVFTSMRSQIPIAPPLATLVICMCVLPALQAMFVSTEEYAKVNEAAHEQTSEIMTQLAEMLVQTSVGEFVDDEESRQDLIKEQLEQFNTPESLRTQKQIYAMFAPMIVLFNVGLVVLLEATYFLIAGNMMKCSKQWSDWIGFTLWTTIPVVLFYVLYTAATLWSGEYHPVGFQAPLSWIPGFEKNVFALTLTVPVLWTLWIRTVGMHHWVEKPIPNCLLIVLIPTVVGLLITAGSLQMSRPYMDLIDSPTTEQSEP